MTNQAREAQERLNLQVRLIALLQEMNATTDRDGMEEIFENAIRTVKEIDVMAYDEIDQALYDARLSVELTG